jgi:hypothetical protein
VPPAAKTCLRGAGKKPPIKEGRLGCQAEHHAIRAPSRKRRRETGAGGVTRRDGLLSPRWEAPRSPPFFRARRHPR